MPVSLPVISDPRALRKSKSAPRRAIVLAVVQVLMIAHVVQWAIMGRSISPVEPSESMETVKQGVINAGAVFFAAALLATLVLGRWFCGWGCHLVMLQDGCAWIMRRIGIRPRQFRSRLLVYVPFVLALYMFVWPVVYRWGVAPLSESLHQRFSFVPALGRMPDWTGFTVHVTTTDFWQTFPGIAVTVPFLLVCGFATVYFLGSKGFCTYGCPYGGFFAPLDQYAVGRIRVSDACEGCGHCTAVCSSNVRVHEEVREYGMVVDPGCMKCLDCVSVCPKNALSFGFGRPAIRKGPARHAAPKPRYDLTYGEEAVLAVVFLGTFVAVRGVYGLIPMLMAVGVAGCVTFMTWKLRRMFRDASVNLHRFRLRFKGRVTTSGGVFAALTVLALTLVGHSGVVNAFEFIGERADARVTMPRALLFSAAPMELPPAMAAEATRALKYLDRVRPVTEGGIGLLRHPENDVRRAWLHACRHEFAEAEAILRDRSDRVGPTDLVCRDIALLMRFERREREARAYAHEIVAAHPDFVETYDGLIVDYESEGLSEEAIRVCREAVDRNDDPEKRLHLLRRLSLLLVENGHVDEGIEVFHETISMDDTNPATFVMLARAYLRKNEPDKAVQAIERGIDLAPGSAEILDEMADLMDVLGREQEARAYRNRAQQASNRALGVTEDGHEGHDH